MGFSRLTSSRCSEGTQGDISVTQHFQQHVLQLGGRPERKKMLPRTLQLCTLTIYSPRTSATKKNRRRERRQNWTNSCFSGLRCGNTHFRCQHVSTFPLFLHEASQARKKDPRVNQRHYLTDERKESEVTCLSQAIVKTEESLQWKFSLVRPLKGRTKESRERRGVQTRLKAQQIYSCYLTYLLTWGRYWGYFTEPQVSRSFSHSSMEPQPLAQKQQFLRFRGSILSFPLYSEVLFEVMIETTRHRCLFYSLGY